MTTSLRALRVLLVEDSEDDALLLLADLEAEGYAPEAARVDTAAAMRAALEREAWDVVISDDSMPAFSALDALRLLQEKGLDLPFLIVSGTISDERAVAAMRAGAHDYILKGNRSRLIPAIERELREARGRQARREAEASLRQAEADRALQRAKAELVSTVSHELRTPLASVLGALELLSAGEAPAEARDQLLEVALREGRRLKGVIENWLNLQRLEHGGQPLAFAAMNVRRAAGQAAAELGEDAPRPLALVVPDDLPPVWADADQLHLVLSNLLANARKYSPAGGGITLAARPAGSLVEVSVRDQGIGIPPDALPRLFEQFYRVDGPHRRSISGTGLGLAICRRIVEAHGGRIWAESEGEGRGSTFTFSLPAAPLSATAAGAAAVADANSASPAAGAALGRGGGGG
jgi:signal transduction histidine kinase